MAGVKSWPQRLRDRCEAVGWTVTLTKSGHFKVRTYRGRGFSFPQTPSDWRAERNAMSEARRQGLERLEVKVAKDAETQRIQRIAKDRQSVVGQAFTDAVMANVEAETEEEEGMKKTVANVTGALGYVDGVAIAELAPAMIESPVSNGPRPMTDGEELLLVDERVVYRCVKPAATVTVPDAKGMCHRIFDSPASLRSHMTYHTRKTVPVPPPVKRKEAREALQRTAEALARRRAEEQQTKRSPSAVDQPTKKADESAAQPVGIIARASQLVDRFDRLKKEFAVLESDVESIADELRALVQVLPENLATDDMVTAARKYEELRKLIG